MKKKELIILGILISISLLFSYIIKDNKEENNKEISKVEKILSKPDGIQAFTLYGEKTDISYNDLIEGYEIDSITCKNGTIATYNKDDNSVSLSNIHMPDYCTMDFKKGIYTVTFNSGNLLYDLKDVSNINSEYITYSVKDEVVTVTGKNDDGYGFINARVYLEANNTYIFNCDTNGVWGTNPGTNTVEAFLMLNGEYNTFYHLYNNKKFEFTPNVTGVYWLRLDVNATNKTYTFYNINISKNISSKNIGYKDVYGEFPTYSRDGYMMLGWYLEDGTKVDSTSINYTKRDHSITAKWSRYNYEVKLNVVNGSGSATKTVEHGSSVSFTGIRPSTGYSSSNPTISCTGGSLSGSTLTVSNVTSSRTCTVTFKPGTLLVKLLADNPTISTRTDFSTTFTTTNTGTLYKATEKNVHNASDTIVYYFAGDAKNNWVKFGKYKEDFVIYRGQMSSTKSIYMDYLTMDACTSASSYNVNCTAYKYASAGDPIYWRIIRTNADGSIRLLYAGTSPDTEEGYIGLNAFNLTADDPMYAGYMYGTSGTLASNRTNENNSTIKTYIDNWYSNNLSSYSKYISTVAVYCNDRNEASEGTYTTKTGKTFSYAAPTRLNTNKTPSYNCTNSKDAFSGSNVDAKLTYPVALMTADEISYAGGVWQTSLTSPYAWYCLNSAGGNITRAVDYWYLLSPFAWYGFKAGMLNVSRLINGAGGSLVYSGGYVNDPRGVRPVISIKSCALWLSGNGSSSSPYEINGGC